MGTPKTPARAATWLTVGSGIAPVLDSRYLFLGKATRAHTGHLGVTDTFQYNLKVPKNLSSGTRAIVVEVSAPDGSGVVNKESVEVTIRR